MHRKTEENDAKRCKMRQARLDLVRGWNVTQKLRRNLSAFYRSASAPRPAVNPPGGRMRKMRKWRKEVKVTGSVKSNIYLIKGRKINPI